jgi:signal transduction histidine kinase
LALLWRAGARLTVPVALVELGVDLATGAITLDGPHWAMAIIGVVRPVIAYGLVVVAVRRLETLAAPRRVMFAAPVPFAVASVFAPVCAALFALPQALQRPELTGVTTAREVILSLNAFAIGDLLGVLLLAPPLLWVADRLTGRRAGAIVWPPRVILAEAAGVFGLGVGIETLLYWVGLGLQPAPMLVAVAWIGLRLGRPGAWAALLVVVSIALPLTAGPMDTGERIVLHLGLATIMVAGYLTGSFADAQARARADLEVRDRLLFQAERLKTLRAMSVAVIHEISQPLSTLSIEARHLHELTAEGDAQIAAAAALIHTKATDLSDLIRRLRRYGGSAVDEPTELSLGTLVDSVVKLARPEMQAAGVNLIVAQTGVDLIVLGREVELAQAVVNLVRNAARACRPGGNVSLDAVRSSAEDAGNIVVTNQAGTRASPAGMGVGTLIARAIVEAHGGTLVRNKDAAGIVRATISLPLLRNES